MEKVITIGSKVIYKGAWGTQPEKEVTIEGMQLCKEEGEKYGTDVEEIPWEQKNYGVYDLSDGHWCYGYQIVSLVEKPEPEDIFNEVKENKVIEHLLDKSSRESEHQTIYGDLNDYMKDMYFNVLSPEERNDIVVRLLGDYVIHHPYCLQETYIVLQESNVDGDVTINPVPCASLELAKKVMKQMAFDITNSSEHYSGYSDSEFEECFEVESDDMHYFISDNFGDYYEDIRIIQKNIFVK